MKVYNKEWLEEKNNYIKKTRNKMILLTVSFIVISVLFFVFLSRENKLLFVVFYSIISGVYFFWLFIFGFLEIVSTKKMVTNVQVLLKKELNPQKITLYKNPKLSITDDKIVAYKYSFKCDNQSLSLYSYKYLELNLDTDYNITHYNSLIMEVTNNEFNNI